MDNALSDELVWSGGLAARLRMLQANYAEDAADVREAQLADEVERSLKGVSPSDRPRFLNRLEGQFPLVESGSATPVASAPAEAPREVSVEEFIERFIEIAAAMPAPQRAALQKRLAAAGLVPEQTATGAAALSPTLSAKLKWPAGTPVNAERASNLLSSLIEMTLLLDTLAWNTWRQVASSSTMRKEWDFARLAVPYLSGNAETATPQIVRSLEHTRKLISGLIGGIGRVGGDYETEYQNTFAPDRIRFDAEKEAGTFGSKEKIAWKKFEELNREYLADGKMGSRIRQLTAESAEQLMFGGNTGQ